MNIKCSDRNPVLSKEGKAGRWKEYIGKLYKGNELKCYIIEKEKEEDEDEIGNTTLQEEFDRPLKVLSQNKAPGVDDIPSELLIYLGEAAITKLFQLVCKVHWSKQLGDQLRYLGSEVLSSAE